MPLPTFFITGELKDQDSSQQPYVVFTNFPLNRKSKKPKFSHAFLTQRSNNHLDSPQTASTTRSKTSFSVISAISTNWATHLPRSDQWIEKPNDKYALTRSQINSKQLKEKRNYFSTRSNDDVVDGNKDELDEEPHKSHHDEANSSTKSHLSKF